MFNKFCTVAKANKPILPATPRMEMATSTLSSGTINSLTRKTLPLLTKNTKPLFSFSLCLTLKASKSTLRAVSMSYDKELAAAKNAASLAARLCQV